MVIRNLLKSISAQITIKQNFIEETLMKMKHLHVVNVEK